MPQSFSTIHSFAVMVLVLILLSKEDVSLRRRNPGTFPLRGSIQCAGNSSRTHLESDVERRDPATVLPDQVTLIPQNLWSGLTRILC